MWYLQRINKDLHWKPRIMLQKNIVVYYEHIFKRINADFESLQEKSNLLYLRKMHCIFRTLFVGIREVAQDEYRDWS